MTALDDEIKALRDRVAELEASETGRERAEQVQNALYRIAETASTAEDMQAFYAEMHRIVGELMYAGNFYIALYDGEREAISWPFHVDELDEDWPDPNAWEPMGTGQARGITGYLIQAGRPMLLSNEDWKRLAARGEIVMVGEESVTWLGVPLQSEGKTLGAVVVQSYREETAHTEADKELLTFVGRHIASALERTRLIDETRQRNAELSLINDVQRGLAMNLDMQAMYDLVGDRLQEIFDAQVVDIGVLDEDAGLIHFPYTIEKGVRFRTSRSPSSASANAVLETREPLLFNVVTDEMLAAYGQPGVHPGRAREVLRVRAARGRGQGDRGDLAAERRPRARLRRCRPSAPDHARGEPERRARERSALRGDTPAQRRARPRSTTCSGGSPRTSTCSRCTTSSVTGSRRSSTPRWSISSSSTRPTGLIRFAVHRSSEGSDFHDRPDRAHRVPQASSSRRGSPSSSTTDVAATRRRVRPSGSARGRSSLSPSVFVPLLVGEQGDRADLAPEHRSRARLQRRRRPPPDDSGREPQRRARERPALRGDPPAERRARAHQRRPARPGREPRDAGDVRPRRRSAPGDLRRPGRRHRRARRETTTSSISRTSIETGERFTAEPTEPHRRSAGTSSRRGNRSASTPSRPNSSREYGQPPVLVRGAAEVICSSCRSSSAARRRA